MTVASLAHALDKCTKDDILIESARRLGQQIRQENGVATAIEAIYRDLDYARSLVKCHTRLAHKPEQVSLSDPPSVEHEGAASDGSSGWDILSERNSSAHTFSEEEEAEAVGRKAPMTELSSDEERANHSRSPLHRSTSHSLKRTLSRAHSILPASLLARRRSTHTSNSPRKHAHEGNSGTL